MDPELQREIAQIAGWSAVAGAGAGSIATGLSQFIIAKVQAKDKKTERKIEQIRSLFATISSLYAPLLTDGTDTNAVVAKYEEVILLAISVCKKERAQQLIQIRKKLDEETTVLRKKYLNVEGQISGQELLAAIRQNPDNLNRYTEDWTYLSALQLTAISEILTDELRELF